MSDSQMSPPLLNFTILNQQNESDAISYSTVTPTNSQFNSNQHVNKYSDSYTIERKIGDPSTSSVMLVRCKRERSQLMALKIIDQSNITGLSLDAYLHHLTAIPSHPYLIDLKQTFISNSSLYLLMEYCPGGGFLDFLKSQKRFSEDVARFYLAEIMSGLSELHNLGFSRGLAIEDLLLDADGHIKISHFGGEKQLLDQLEKEDSDSDEDHRNNNGHFKAKYLKMNKQSMNELKLEGMAYLPPEMLEKDAKFSRNSDFWLLGVLLYQMVAGEPPFCLRKVLESSSFNFDKIKKVVKESEPKFPKGISVECKGLIWGLLRKQPSERLGAKGWKEVKNSSFFEGFPWKMVQTKQVPAPFSSTCQLNCLQKKEEFKKFWKVQEDGLKKPNAYLQKTLFVGTNELN